MDFLIFGTQIITLAKYVNVFKTTINAKYKYMNTFMK